MSGCDFVGGTKPISRLHQGHFIVAVTTKFDCWPRCGVLRLLLVGLNGISQRPVLAGFCPTATDARGSRSVLKIFGEIRARSKLGVAMNIFLHSRGNQKMLNTKAWSACGIRTLSLFIVAAAAQAATGSVDAPLPVFNTNVVIASNTGKMLWLDSNTLAITTYAKGSDYWDGKTVAVDVVAKSTFTLVERGFLQCASNGGLVSMLKGSMVRQFWGPEKDATTPMAVRVFYHWNSKTRKLEAEEPAPKPPWNWFICAETGPNDIELPKISFYQRNVRYLDARDGVLRWEGPDSMRNAGRVVLAKANEATKPLDVVAGDIALVPQLLPFADRYLLATGQFVAGGARIERFGEKTDQLPAITMTRDGRVSRLPLPQKLKVVLDGFGSTEGQTRPTAVGLLVYVNGWVENGGGLYLSVADAAKRIWCTPAPGKVQPCTIEDWELSPDGCNLAFVPQRDYPKTVKVIRLCSPTSEK